MGEGCRDTASAKSGVCKRKTSRAKAPAMCSREIRPRASFAKDCVLPGSILSVRRTFLITPLNQQYSGSTFFGPDESALLPMIIAQCRTAYTLRYFIPVWSVVHLAASRKFLLFRRRVTRTCRKPHISSGLFMTEDTNPINKK